MRDRDLRGVGGHVSRTLLAIALGLLLVGVPNMAAAHCCKEVASVRLQPIDPIATPRLRGRAVILDCFGVISMLDVIVTSPEADGTTYAPALPGTEPILGDFFSLSAHRGEGFILDISASQVQGRTVSVFDQNFTEVMSGTF